MPKPRRRKQANKANPPSRKRIEYWKDIKPLYEQGYNARTISDMTGFPYGSVYDLLVAVKGDDEYIEKLEQSSYKLKPAFVRGEEDVIDTEREAILQNVKLKGQLQKLRDQRNLAEKRLREMSRSTTELNKELLRAFEAIAPKLDLFTPTALAPTKQPKNKKVGIIQLSDLHLNESVRLSDTGGGNEYNFSVAAKRLKKYAAKCIDMMQHQGVSQVVIAMTGDMLNSDRRYDEKMRNTWNNAVGFFAAQDLVTQFITEISHHFETVEVASVYGNESRLADDIHSVNFSNSWDWLMHRFMSVRFEDIEHVHFHEMEDSHEKMIRILGLNILLFHGHNKLDFKKMVSKWARKRVFLDYVLTGHIHEVKIDGVQYSRSASLVGDNAYSHQRLNLSTDAGQTMYIVETEKDKKARVTPYPVNLQCAEGYGSFNVLDEAELFGSQRGSAKKMKSGNMRLVIEITK